MSFLGFLSGALVALQSSGAPEVRQIVSFRFLPGNLSAGFDFFRILGISSLAEWQRYVEALRGAPFADEIEGWIAESHQVILAPVPELSVR